MTWLIFLFQWLTGKGKWNEPCLSVVRQTTEKRFHYLIYDIFSTIYIFFGVWSLIWCNTSNLWESVKMWRMCRGISSSKATNRVSVYCGTRGATHWWLIDYWHNWMTKVNIALYNMYIIQYGLIFNFVRLIETFL
jgi:hypothetical protein